MAVVLKKKDRNLLLCSQAGQDPAWFWDVLSKNETLSDEQMEGLDESQQTFIKSMLGSYLQQARTEWIGEIQEGGVPAIDLGDARVECSLCGYPETKYMYVIVNQINGNRINIGSTCQNDYEFNLGMEGRTNSSIMRSAKRFKAETEWNIEFPGISRRIFFWESVLDNYPVLIPARLANPYEECGKSARNIFNDYINHRIDKESAFRTMRKLVADGDTFVRDMEEYAKQKSQENALFTVYRSTVNWALERNRKKLLERLMEDEGITIDTVCYVSDPEFMNRLLPHLKEMLDPRGVKLLGITGDESGYELSYDRMNLTIRHASLLHECKARLFHIPAAALDRKRILSACQVALDEKREDPGTLTTFLNLVEQKMNAFRMFPFRFRQKNEYDPDQIVYEGFDTEYGETVWQRDGQLFIFDLKEFAVELWPFLVGAGKYSDPDYTEKTFEKMIQTANMSTKGKFIDELRERKKKSMSKPMYVQSESGIN